MNQSISTDSKNSKEPQQKYRLGTVSITSSPKVKDRSPESNVQGQILFKKSGDTDVLDAQGQLTQ